MRWLYTQSTKLLGRGEALQLAPLYPVLYQILKPTFGSCLWSGDRSKAMIALTFDDGPHPIYTPPLLKVLEHYQVPASFFWLGCWVERYPTLAKEVYQQGHWLGLHGYYHHSFPLLSAAALRESLGKTKKAISSACQIAPDKLQDVRPPNGLFTPNVLRQLQQDGYRVVMWSVVPEDWVHPGRIVVRQRVLDQVSNGSLIVLHDGHYGGQDVAKITADLLPRLLHQGYRFVTVDEFWRQKNSSV